MTDSPSPLPPERLRELLLQVQVEWGAPSDTREPASWYRNPEGPIAVETMDAATARIGELEAHITELQCANLSMAQDIADTRALLRKAEEAMRPFADVADDFDADGRELEDSDGVYANVAGDFRRARAVVAEIRKEIATW
jgi:hypothetical protein